MTNHTATFLIVTGDTAVAYTATNYAVVVESAIHGYSMGIPPGGYEVDIIRNMAEELNLHICGEYTYREYTSIWDRLRAAGMWHSLQHMPIASVLYSYAL